jgi:lipoic acid synthetase
MSPDVPPTVGVHPLKDPRLKPAGGPRERLAPWLRKRLPQGGTVDEVRSLVGDLELHTVCQSARCPNLNECWSKKAATFMILGDLCTRTCRFCTVPKGKPLALDPAEPDHVAEAAQRLGLQHVVVTSVDRDDLPDQGAGHFAATIGAIRERLPAAVIEVLTPDFRGEPACVDTVTDARPHIYNHNLETVPWLYARVRPGAVYDRSLALLRRVKERRPGTFTKSGLMLGLGETEEQLLEVMRDLRAAGVDILTLGQYLRPTLAQLPVERYVPPEEFAALGDAARALGFLSVAAGPFVRSSYNAAEVYSALGVASGAGGS